MELMSFISEWDSGPDWRRVRRARMLAAALDLLRGKRLEEVSMDEIAAAAGVGKATLYRYFSSKEDLLSTCLEEIVDALRARMTQAEEAEAPVEVRLRAVVGAMVGAFSEHLLPLQLLTRRQSDLQETWRHHVSDARAGLVTVLERHFERGQAEGAYRNIDMALMPHMVMGMIRSCVTHAGQPDERVASGICRFIAQAVGTHDGQGKHHGSA